MILNNDTNSKRFSLDLLIKNKSVAVVGNSLSLFDSEYGKEIDSHDVVIRFNKPAILLNNTNVSHGSKFDIWAFWAVGAFYNVFIKERMYYTDQLETFLHNKNIHKIQVSMNGYSTLTREYISHTMPIKMFMSLRYNLRYIGSEFSRESSLTPSAGIGILEWLRHSQPSSVSVYGFDFKKTPTFSEPERYKSDMVKQFDTRCRHDYAAEELFANKYIFSDKRFRLLQ